MNSFYHLFSRFNLRLAPISENIGDEDFSTKKILTVQLQYDKQTNFMVKLSFEREKINHPNFHSTELWKCK